MTTVREYRYCLVQYGQVVSIGCDDEGFHAVPMFESHEQAQIVRKMFAGHTPASSLRPADLSIDTDYLAQLNARIRDEGHAWLGLFLGIDDAGKPVGWRFVQFDQHIAMAPLRFDMQIKG
jgi:hypothetical protein